jgi:hypothetical protein
MSVRKSLANVDINQSLRLQLFMRPSTMKEFSLTSGDLQLQAGQREKFAINQVIKV